MAPLLVGHADDDLVDHVLVLAERSFDFGGKYVGTAGDDHVLAAIASAARVC